MLHRRHCPLCGSEAIENFKKGTIRIEDLGPQDFKITDSRYGSSWDFTICRSCRFVFANPVLPPEEIARFYSNLEDGEYAQEAAGRAKNFATILKRLERIDAPSRELLDVGAASGIFMDLARRQGYKVAGIEPSAFLVEEAKRLYGLDLFCGTIDQFPADRTFSVILLLDILEHLVDVEPFMKRIDDLIKPGGILVVVTPDISSLPARILRKRWWHLRTAHVNFFNHDSLGRLLDVHGYDIVRRAHYAWNFSLYYLLSRRFQRLKRSTSLQSNLKNINLRLQLFDSLEIYARKRQN